MFGGGFSMGSLLLILLIVVLVFGTRKFKSLGSDLGGAIKGFRKAMSDDDEKTPAQLPDDSGSGDSVSQKSETSQHR